MSEASHNGVGNGVFPYLRRAGWNSVALGLGEVLVLAGSLCAGGLIRQLWKGEPMIASWMLYLVLGWLVGAMVLRLLPGWGLGPVEELRRMVILLFAVFGGTTAMLFWGKAAHETSRFTLTVGLFLTLVLQPLARLQIKRLLLRRGQWGVPTAVYADATMAPRLLHALTEERGLGYVPVGLFMDDPPADRTVAGLPVLGTVRDATPQAAVALVGLPGLAGGRLVELLEGPLASYRRVVLIPDLQEAPTLWVKPRDLVGMLGLEISQNLLDPLSRFIKRSFDLIFVLLTLPVWGPLCLAIALLVWLQDRAHPLFLQDRLGAGGRPFRTWKFRTMRPDAEEALRRELDRDPELREEWERHFKLRVDPRITPLGRLLRQTSLDELPQLVNVLRGEMSLVGPRPLPAYHVEELPERVRALRARVRPGITGLWQVSGRSDSGLDGMAKWDAYYVRNWSVWLDIVIFVRTLRAVTSRRGAY